MLRSTYDTWHKSTFKELFERNMGVRNGRVFMDDWNQKFQSFISQYLRDYYMEQDCTARISVQNHILNYFENDGEVVADISPIASMDSVGFCVKMVVDDILHRTSKINGTSHPRSLFVRLDEEYRMDVIQAVYEHICTWIPVIYPGYCVATIHGMSHLYEESSIDLHSVLIVYCMPNDNSDTIESRCN